MSVAVMPQAPGRAPAAELRRPGAEQCWPGGTTPRNPPHAPHSADLRASGTTKRGTSRRASGATSREGADERRMTT